MNKIINFIESEWYRPIMVTVAFVIIFTWSAIVLAIAEKRDAPRIETQTQSWKAQGYPIGE